MGTDGLGDAGVAVCPRCGADDALTIVYGDPIELLALGEVLGGCIVHADSPARECGSCGHRWGRLEWDTTEPVEAEAD